MADSSRDQDPATGLFPVHVAAIKDANVEAVCRSARMCPEALLGFGSEQMQEQPQKQQEEEDQDRPYHLRPRKATRLC